MSRHISVGPSINRVPESSTHFMVRSVLLGASVQPYGWEIVNAQTGEVVRRSGCQYRKPGEAWAAGTATLKAG